MLTIYFDLDMVPLTLKPLSLSHEYIKLEPFILSKGVEGFLLDVEKYQFYKIYIHIAERINIFTNVEVVSVLYMIKALHWNKDLHVIFTLLLTSKRWRSCQKIMMGYIAFELPPSASKSTMYEMEQKNDNHC